MPRSPAQFEAMRIASQEKIIKSALKLFAQFGYKATTISMVARDSGVSGGLVYAYYEDKEKLLDRVLFETFVKLDSLFAGPEIRLATALPLPERVDKAFEIVMGRMDCFQLLVQLMMQDGTPPQAIEEIKNLTMHCRNKLAGLFPEEAGRHLPSMIHAAVTSYMVYRNKDLLQQQWDAIRQLSVTLQTRMG